MRPWVPDWLSVKKIWPLSQLYIWVSSLLSKGEGNMFYSITLPAGSAN